jgi:hypothetical protein
MSSLWKLDFAGDRRTLKGWGLENKDARLIYKAFEPDEFTAFRAEKPNLATEDPLFEWNAEFAIYRGTTRVLLGRVPDSPAYATAARERQALRALGVYEDLNRVTFKQDRTHHPEEEEAGITIATPRAVLFVDEDLDPVELKPTIEASIDVAIARGVSIQRGTIEPSGLQPPPEEVQDLSVGALIQRAYRWAPDAVPWIDYTTTPPTIHIRRRGNLAAVNIALGDTEELKIAPCEKLLLEGVIIHIRKVRDRSYYSSPAVFYATDTAGITTGLRVAEFEINVVDPRYNPPTGLAAAYLSMHNTLHWEGHVVLPELEPTIAIRPGNVLNITGGRSAWTTMNALVNEVEIQIDTGRTIVRFGPPLTLNFGDFFALFAPGANVKPPLGDPPDGLLPITWGPPSTQGGFYCRRSPGNSSGQISDTSEGAASGHTLTASATASWTGSAWSVALSMTLAGPGGASARLKNEAFTCSDIPGDLADLAAPGTVGATDSPVSGPVTKGYNLCINLNAITPLSICLPATGGFSEWAEVDMDETCDENCMASHPVSGDGCSTWTAQFRVVRDGLLTNGWYRIGIDLMRRPAGSGPGGFGLDETVYYEAQAGADGSLTFEGEVPNLLGYDTCAKFNSIVAISGPTPE